MAYKANVAVLHNAQQSMVTLAQKLKLPLVEAVNSDYQAYLLFENDQLQISLRSNQETFSVSVNFSSDQQAFRRQKISIKSEPLLRAVGCSMSKPLTVIDATAGWGRDSFLLANYNCQVTMLEQAPIVVALLEDGLRRATQDPVLQPIVQRLRLVRHDAVDYLMHLSVEPQVVYLDPMFPPRSKSAKVKKDMQILHALLGSSDDSSDARLLEVALSRASNRVVVKRPKTAEFLTGKKPSHSITTKAMRYDVYMQI